MLTPSQSTAIPDLRLFAVAETIAQCGDQLSLSVVRQDKESCVSSARERTARCFTTDGTHTNIEERVATAIIWPTAYRPFFNGRRIPPIA